MPCPLFILHPGFGNHSWQNHYGNKRGVATTACTFSCQVPAPPPPTTRFPFLAPQALPPVLQGCYGCSSPVLRKTNLVSLQSGFFREGTSQILDLPFMRQFSLAREETSCLHTWAFCKREGPRLKPPLLDWTGSVVPLQNVLSAKFNTGFAHLSRRVGLSLNVKSLFALFPHFPPCQEGGVGFRPKSHGPKIWTSGFSRIEQAG